MSESSTQTLTPRGHTFFSPPLAPQRRAYIKLILLQLVLIILVIWAALPLYWGSLRFELTHGPSLDGWIVDRDGGAIGQGITQALINSTTGVGDPYNGKGYLGWKVADPAVVGDDDAVANSVVNEAVWVAVVISPGATARLIAAREQGDSTYNASLAITWYFSEARNEDASDFLVSPLTVSILDSATAKLNQKLAQEYLQAQYLNASAMAALALAPQTISGPVSYTEMNLRPYTAPAATAVELVGSIYLIIVAFIWSLGHAAARDQISPHLTTRSYLLLRIASPLLIYIPLSLAYAMISLPFKLPFDGRYTYAGGFFLFWCFCYLALCALGLAIEAMVTILTPRFAPFFLVPWIISNVSDGVNIPFELMPWFYRYGCGFPVFNLSLAVRTILFNTRNRLALNAGVLLAWAALSLVTMPLFTLLVRWREEKQDKRKEKFQE